MRTFFCYCLILASLLLSACDTPDTSTSEPAAQEQSINRQTNQAFKVLDISERSYDGGTALTVTFSAPVNSSQDLNEFLKVALQAQALSDGAWVLSDNRKQAYFPAIQPETEYTVSVYPGLQSADGQRLATNAEAKVATRRVSAGVSFTSQGNFLPIKLADGLPVSTINISQVNVEFFRIRQRDLLSFANYMDDNAYWYEDEVQHAVAYGELVYGGRFELEAAENKRRDYRLPLKHLDALQTPGVYLAVMRAAGDYGRAPQLSYFSVTDLGLHARVYAQQLDVYVSSLASGKAIKRVQVQLLNQKGEILESRETTAEGLASFAKVPKDAQSLIAQLDGNFSYLALRGPALDLSEFDLGENPQQPENVFIYGPRDLYRPGETAVFSALRRDYDGRSLPDVPLTASWLRPDGVAAKTMSLTASGASYYQTEFNLPKQAPTGQWRLQLERANEVVASYAFQVEEFLPERMELEFAPGSKAPMVVSAKDSWALPLSGRYLYGAPAAGNRVSAYVYASPAKDPVTKYPGFQFGNVLSEVATQNLDLDEIHLDDDGQGALKIPAEWRNSTTALSLKVQASLYESGGRPVSRSYQALLWPGDAMIGIKPEFDSKTNPPDNSLVEFSVVKTRQDGTGVAAQNLEVRLISEDRQYFWEFSSDRGWHWNWTDKEFVTYSQSLDLAVDEVGKLQIPVEYGRYRLEILDSDNQQQLSSLRFYAGEDWYYWWRHNNGSGRTAKRPDQVDLAFDKGGYAPGDTAELRIISPHDGQAIVLVEADKPLWFTRTLVSASGSSVSIPIDPSWDRHDIYVSVVVFRDGDKAQRITPTRALGLKHLPLDRSARQLQVELTPPANMQPNTQLMVPVKVGHKAASSNQPIYLTLAAVDVGVLNISRFETPDPFLGFFSPARYGVDIRDLYDRIIELSDAPSARLRFGGDAEDDVARGGEQAKAEVNILSLYSGLVTVPADGVVQVPLSIPEFDGRVRLMALAFSEDSYGSADADVTIASPIVSQIALPRFMAFGDHSEIALDVTNLSGAEQTLQLAMQATAPLQLASESQTFTLADGERRSLHFKVQALPQSGRGEVIMNLSGSGFDAIEKRWGLQVRSAYPAVTRSSSQLLKAGEQFSLRDSIDLKGLLPETITAAVSLSTHADLQLQAQLSELIQYPYGCLEQTTSGAYPLAYASGENLQKVGITRYSPAEIQARIDKGIERLLSLQKRSGGFGLWDERSPEEHWLTAYVGDFLLSAQTNGFSIDADMLDQVMARLSQYLQRRGPLAEARWSEDANHYSFASKAYAAYVLAQTQRAPLAALRTLYDLDGKYAKTGLPLMHLGLALLQQGDTQRAEQALTTGLGLLETAYQGSRWHYWGDYGSEIRDLAMGIHLLLKHQQHVGQAQTLSYKLAQLIRTKRYLSTQEHNALFLAGIDLNSLPATPWSGELLRAAESLPIADVANYQRAFAASASNQDLALRIDQGERLYASFTVSGYLREAPAPEMVGMQINRHYYDSKGQLVNDLSHVQSGDLYVVELLVSAEQRTPDALVIDLLPAGFEPENQNLASSASIGDIKIDDSPLAELLNNDAIKYQEYRDDRYVAAVDVGRYRRRVRLFYLVRAVTPGTYSLSTPLAEDMYRPEVRALGEAGGRLVIESANKP